METTPNTVVIHEQAGRPVTFTSEIDGSNYSMALLQKAYSLYMLQDMRLEAIAKETGIPLVVVEEIFAKSDWLERKRRYAEQTILSLNAELARTQARERVETIKRHIEKAREVVDKAQEMALQQQTPRSLKDAVEAMTSAATMEARAAGVAEKTVQRDVGPTGMPPVEGDLSKMVWVGISVRPPAAKEEKQTIDVTSEVRPA